MGKEPCLCGDPYCPSCGNPSALALEGAVDDLLDAFNLEGFTFEEYEIAKEISIATVRTFRKLLKEITTQRCRECMYVTEGIDSYPSM